MNYNKKKEIINAEEIYRIKSVFPKYKNFIKVISYSTLTILVVTAIIETFKYTPKDLSIYFTSALCAAYIAFSVLLNRTFSRGNPLVFTKTGVYLKPFIYEYWQDIVGYGFKKYEGVYRITFSKKGSGLTLILYNEGTFQRTINLRGQSFTATNGIFFDADRIAEIEKILSEHGIKRRMLGDEI